MDFKRSLFAGLFLVIFAWLPVYCALEGQDEPSFIEDSAQEWLEVLEDGSDERLRMLPDKSSPDNYWFLVMWAAVSPQTNSTGILPGEICSGRPKLFLLFHCLRIYN